MTRSLIHFPPSDPTAAPSAPIAGSPELAITRRFGPPVGPEELGAEACRAAASLYWRPVSAFRTFFTADHPLLEGTREEGFELATRLARRPGDACAAFEAHQREVGRHRRLLMLNAFAPILLVYLGYTITMVGSTLVSLVSPLFSMAYVLAATVLLQDLRALDLYTVINGIPQVVALFWVWPFIAAAYVMAWSCARTGRSSGRAPRRARSHA